MAVRSAERRPAISDGGVFCFENVAVSLMLLSPNAQLIADLIAVVPSF